MLIDAALWFVLAAGADATVAFVCPPEVIANASPSATGWRVDRQERRDSDATRLPLRSIQIIAGEPVTGEPPAILVPDNVDRLGEETTARWQLSGASETWLACDYRGLRLVRRVGMVRRCWAAHYVGEGPRGRVECSTAGD